MLYRLISGAALVLALAGGAGAAETVFSWNQAHARALDASREKDYAGAMELFRELWNKAGTNTERAAAAQDLGTLLHYTGNDREAQVWLARAAELWRGVPGSVERLPTTLQQLGVVYHRLGDYRKAEELLREALGQKAITATAQLNAQTALADLMREQGRLAEARQLLQSAVVSGEAPWTASLEALMGLAGVEREAGSAEQSVARWTEAVNLARVHEASAFEGICLRGLGEALLEQQLLARALPVLRRSVHVLESAGAERRDSFQLANSRRALAEAYLIDGKPVQAEEEVRQGLELLEKGGLEMHPQAAALFDTLAEALAAQAKLGPALDSLGKAEAIILAHFGRGSAMALTTAAKRGVLEERAGQAEAAVRDLAESLRRMENAGSDLDRTRVRLMRYYAAALEATHRKKQAKAVRAEIRTLSVE